MDKVFWLCTGQHQSFFLLFGKLQKYVLSFKDAIEKLIYFTQCSIKIAPAMATFNDSAFP